jgi:hypothetical protein
MLLEGGNAAERLIPKLKENGAPEDIQYSKIPQSEMGSVFKEIVRPLLAELGKAGLIDPEYKTEFGLGSTRLAAHVAGEKVKLLPSETPDVVAGATSRKKSFGDLDLDVVVSDEYSLKKIGQYLVQKDPARFQYMPQGAEINVAVVWDGNRVIQIDIVDVKGDKKQEMEFEQSSSMVDLASGVKGMFHKMLLRSIVLVKDLDRKDREEVRAAIADHPEIQKWLGQGYDFKIPGREEGTKVGRFMLGKGGIQLVVDLFKPGRKEGSVTRKKIVVGDNPRFSLHDLEQFAAAVIPGATLDDVNSALKLAKLFARKYPEKIDDLWDRLENAVEPFKGSVGEDDYQSGMRAIANALGIGWKG